MPTVTENPPVQEVRRFDALETSPSLRRTPEGFMVARGVVAKVGILRYNMPDGSVRREMVTEEHLFDPESLASCQMLPVSVGHTSEGDGFIYPKNSKRLSVGSTGQLPVRNDHFLETDIMIHAQEGLDAVDNGIQHLSLGYKCEVVLEPGEWNGEPYDGYQRKRRYNHLALVRTARAGVEARINLDGDSAMPENLVTVHLDGGLTYQAAPEVAAALTKAKAEADTLKVRLDEATAKVKDAEGRAKSAESRLTDPATIAGLVANRLRIEKTAALVLPEGTNLDGLDNEQLMAESVKAWSPKINLDGKDSVYVTACFDAMAAAMESEEEDEDEDEEKPKGDMKGKKDAYMGKMGKAHKKDKKCDADNEAAIASQRKQALSTKIDGTNQDPVTAARARMNAAVFGTTPAQ